MEYITREPDENRGNTLKIRLPIAIKTTRTGNSKSRSRNANPKFRKNGYVTMFLPPFNCKNKRLSIAVIVFLSPFLSLLSVLTKA
jgi:hypothetical protein